VLLADIYLLSVVHYPRDPFRAHCGFYPCGAADFLRSHPELLQSRMLNEYNWGGYLAWVLPDLRLFIDGRMPQYPYRGHSYMEEYHKLYDKDKLEGKLDEYGINLVLASTAGIDIKPNWFEKYILQINVSALEHKERHLLEFLDKNSQWGKIYDDENSIIYRKKFD